MNRIVLIGNGFDLAHGLKTSYKDFIEWYWETLIEKLRLSPAYIEKDENRLYYFEVLSRIQGWKEVLRGFKNSSFSAFEIIENLRANHSFSIRIAYFLDIISKEYERKQWVDIENLYYQALYELCTGKYLLLNEYRVNKERYNIGRLNEEFSIIKELLVKYLQEITKIRPNTISRKDFIVSPLKYQEIAIGSKASWDVFFRERIHNQNIIGKYHEHPEFLKRIVNITEKYQGNRNINYGTEAYLTTEKELYDVLFPERTLLLNFNYTKIAEDYLLRPQYAKRSEINYIHGNIGAPQNMIFGYGDDTDDNYQVIKKKQENEYLKNIKSINYLQSSEYRSLLSFVESAPFQVCIMGHSCGSSDGTLLNTLFEHKNCVSIKPYYHEKEDGTDNYFDIIGNMSRHFTDPKLMRDRVVNKEFCEPLPQVK